MKRFKPKNVKPYSFYFSFGESQIGLSAIRWFMTNLCDAGYYLCSISSAVHHANIPFKDDTFFSYTICIGGSNQRPADKGGWPSL